MTTRPHSAMIRRAESGDADGIIATIKAVYDEYEFGWHPDSYHRDLYTFEAHYLDRNIPFWVAESEGEIVGTGALEFHPYIEGEGLKKRDGALRVGGSDCSIERLYVHPRARRLGIGRKLNEAILAHARSVAARGIEIWSDKEFKAAHALYRSLGAEVVGDRLCHDPAESPEWGFILRLA